MSNETMAVAASALLCLVAVVHLALAAGVRRGDLVWSGQRPRLLSTELRVRSAVSAILLLASAWVLVEVGGLVSIDLIPEAYTLSATFAVTALLGAYFIYVVFKGSPWERLLFGPIVLAGAALAGWLAFG